MPDALRGAHGFAVRVRGVPAATTALVDADELHLRDASGAAVRRLPCADIAEVRRADTDVQVTTVRGETLDIQASDASALDAELVSACCALPELTHALRSLGSTRAGTGTVRQREFFAPLLEARRRAEDAMQRRDVVAAFSA
ncbi:MAG TPA: hypothetical protein VG818_11025, partial [Gemmatimonadaceae bacterium]|nr:hypothetical protein [Gemmatimonadaceae bacterium]